MLAFCRLDEVSVRIGQGKKRAFIASLDGSLRPKH
jgi:hypothetical protein